MKTFEYYRKEFQDLVTLSEWDTEVAHSRADDLLCELCMDAMANENMGISDVSELIALYKQVEKWYA